MTRTDARSRYGSAFRLTLMLLAALALAACTAVERPAESGTESAESAGLQLRAAESPYLLDANASKVTIYTYRGGKLARFGHNHVIEARPVRGELGVTRDLTESRFQFAIVLGDMVVDDEAARRAAGEEFSSEPSAEDIAATRGNMLGADGLDAAQFPEALISGDVASVSGGTATLNVTVEVHGVAQTVTVPATVQRDGAALRITGQTKLVQSAFGITPFSVMLGALTVLDEVDILFDLRAVPRAS